MKCCFVFLGKSGYAYAIFDKESSVHELLLACCQQPQRNSDGRCEYYLNLNSQRSASKRKSVSHRVDYRDFYRLH